MVKKIVAGALVVFVTAGTSFAIKKNNDYNGAVMNTSIAESIEAFGKETGLYDYFMDSIIDEDSYVNNYTGSKNFFNEVADMENCLYISNTLHKEGLDDYNIEYKGIDVKHESVKLDNFKEDYEEYLNLKEEVSNPDKLSDEAIMLHKKCVQMNDYAALANSTLVGHYNTASELGLLIIKINVAHEYNVSPSDVTVEPETTKNPESSTTIKVKDADGVEHRIDAGVYDSPVRAVYACQFREKTTNDIDEGEREEYNSERNDIFERMLKTYKLAIAKTLYIDDSEVKSPVSNHEAKVKYYENSKK